MGNRSIISRGGNKSHPSSSALYESVKVMSEEYIIAVKRSRELF